MNLIIIILQSTIGVLIYTKIYLKSLLTNGIHKYIIMIIIVGFSLISCIYNILKQK